MPSQEKALFQIRERILYLRDKLLAQLVRAQEIDVRELRRLMDLIANLRNQDLGEKMAQELSSFFAWSYKRGLDMVESMVVGTTLEELLPEVPDEIRNAAVFHSLEYVKTIPVVFLDGALDAVRMSFLMQRTPQEAAKEISRVGLVTYRRGMVIVRTESLRLFNESSISRIDGLRENAKERGIKTKKLWVHSDPTFNRQARLKKLPKSKRKGSKLYMPRPHHQAMHNKAADDEGYFTLKAPTGTYRIKGPHDPSLPASEVVNCGCTTRLVLVDG